MIRNRTYAAKFIGFANQVEDWIKRFIWLLAILLLVFQALLHYPATRIWLSRIDRLEGTPVADGSTVADLRTLHTNM